MMILYLKLFWEFFQTGLFAVGGGMATIPFLRSMGTRTGWFTASQLADMIAVAGSTPGRVGVNTATYVGYLVGSQGGGPGWGILGAMTATFALVLPSVIIILIVARVLERFRDNRFVRAAFYGLRPASVGLIAAAGAGLVLMSFLGVESISEFGADVSVDFRLCILALILLVATRWIPKIKNMHAVVFIVFSAIVGVMFGLGDSF